MNITKLSAILVSISLLLLGMSTAISQPKIHFVEKEIDFGKVSYRDNLKGRIYITNTGSDTLVITDVKPGCGCTSAPLSKNKIAPVNKEGKGDTAIVDIEWSVKNFSGNTTKSIDIISNDPKTSKTPVFVKANIIRPFVIQPRYINFDKLYVGKLDSSHTVIKNTSKDDATILDVIKSSDKILVNLKKGDVLKAGESVTLTVTTTPQSAGTVRETIQLQLKHPDEEKLDFTVYGRAIEPQAGNDK